MKKHTKIIACILTILMIVPVLAACNNAAGDTGKGTTDSGSASISALPVKDIFGGEAAKILYLPPNAWAPDRIQQFEYMQHLTRLWPWIQWEMWDCNNDLTTQLSMIQEAIQQKYDILLLVAVDAASTAQLVTQAEDQGVRVLSYLYPVEANHTLHMSNHKYSEGWAMAEAINQYYNGSGNIVVIDEPVEYRGTDPISSGFLDYFEENPGMKIIANQSASFNVDEAQQVVRDIFTVYDDIDVLWSPSPAANIAAKQALEQMDMVGQIDLWAHGMMIDPQIYYIQNKIAVGYMWLDPDLETEYLVSSILFLLSTGFSRDTCEDTPKLYIPSTLLTYDNVWDYFPNRVSMAIWENGVIVGYLD